MAAGVFVVEINGATWNEEAATFLSGQGYSVTARYCTTDSATPGLNNPIPIPDSGHTPSYWKTHALYISGGNGDDIVGDTYNYTYVSSIRWYCDGDLFNWGSDTSKGYVAVLNSLGDDYGILSGNYDQAEGAAGTSGNNMNSEHSQWNASANAETANNLNNAFSVDNRQIQPNANQYRFSKGLVHQAFIGSNAESGNPGTETYVWVWDEVS